MDSEQKYNRIITKISMVKYYLVLLLPIIFSAANCSKGDLYDTTNRNYFAQADTTIHLTILPLTITLELGKSIYIENGLVSFKFHDVVEDNDNNASIRLEVIYNYGTTKLIELNTNVNPRTYDLENGFHHTIDLRALSYANGTYQIVFGYKQHAHW